MQPPTLAQQSGVLSYIHYAPILTGVDIEGDTQHIDNHQYSEGTQWL
jgi:hypothetical protein